MSLPPCPFCGDTDVVVIEGFYALIHEIFRIDHKTRAGATFKRGRKDSCGNGLCEPKNVIR